MFYTLPFANDKYRHRLAYPYIWPISAYLCKILTHWHTNFYSPIQKLQCRASLSGEQGCNNNLWHFLIFSGHLTVLSFAHFTFLTAWVCFLVFFDLTHVSYVIWLLWSNRKVIHQIWHDAELFFLQKLLTSLHIRYCMSLSSNTDIPEELMTSPVQLNLLPPLNAQMFHLLLCHTKNIQLTATMTTNGC